MNRKIVFTVANPLAADIFCGLGGWADGFLAEGFRVVGFDIERHDYGSGSYPGELVLQDVLTLHGSQFRNAAIIVASPPCQKYSYMAMPWSRAKAMAANYRANPELIQSELNALFNACFRIQREASEVAGRYIPLIVENVKGAQPWVGDAAWHYGSFYLWGDVPALMPSANALKCGHPQRSHRNGHRSTAHLTNKREHGIKQHGSGPIWFDTGIASHSSRSVSRKAASAQIAKIPFPLARYIAQVYKPQTSEAVA